MILMGMCVMRAPLNGEVAEIGAVLWDTEFDAPFTCLDVLIKPEGKESIEEADTASHALRIRHGQPLDIRLINPLNRLVAEAALLVTHGGMDRDRSALAEAYGRFGMKLPEVPWVDLMEDIPEDLEIRNSLARLARHHDIPMPLPLRAYSRALATAMIAVRYPLDGLLATAADPLLVVRAEVRYEERDKAKAKGFRWQKAGAREYTKAWVRMVRQGKLAGLRGECDFDVAIIERL